MLKLGDRAKDSITGFTGIVVGRTEWLYGCQRVALKSEELHDGKPIEMEWFDEPQVVGVDVAAIKPGMALPEAPTGGPDRGEERR